jgi:hypothetical protein
VQAKASMAGVKMRGVLLKEPQQVKPPFIVERLKA